MTTTKEEPQVRLYGNLRRPAQPGLLGFGAAASLAALLGMVISIGALAFGGLLPGVVALVITLLAILPTRRSARDGRSGYERVWKRVVNAENKSAKRDVLIAGPAGFSPDGRCRLPGLLAASELQTVRDAYGEEFAVLYIPSTKHYSVAFECAATGQDQVDQIDIDRQVGYWGQTLSHFGEWTDIAGAQVVVETTPDTGLRLKAAVRGRRSTEAPPFSVAVMDELVETYPIGSAQISTRVTITFSSAPRAGQTKRASTAEMHARIGYLLPTIIGLLRVSGAGQSVRVMTAEDITDAIRVAFDPTVVNDVEEARRAGGTGLRWEEAGPVRLRPEDDCLQHDRAWSRTWQMLEPPKGAFQSDCLSRLLSPHPEISRKRVAMLYRPHDSATSAHAVESDVRATTFTASQKRRPHARARAEVRAAEQASQEEASGAGLVRFGIVITATCDSRDDLPAAEAAVRQLTASARLRTRLALGNQEVAFTSALPCGLVLPDQMRVPAQLKDFA